MAYDQLIEQAAKLRRDTFNAFVAHGEAHLGGSFSMIETIVTLYEKILTPADKFILSKAHASFPLCLLLREKGYDTPLTTHLEINTKNGIHCTTGSLGHGLPLATGMALGSKLQKISGKIYVMMSDGECQEGTTWESLLIGSKHKLDNLVVVIDYNKIQALSKINDALPLHNLINKFKSFNWKCHNVKNGHSIKSLFACFKKINNTKKPTVIELFAGAGGMAIGLEKAGFETKMLVEIDKDCVATIRSAAERLGYSHRDIISGAGHDACWINKVAPAAMVMCPCVDGLSHNEAEEISQDWAVAGSNVLFHAVLETAEIVD